MKVCEAISRIDVLKPNRYSVEEKVKWLSNLDFSIKKDVIDTHDGGDKINFEGYTVDKDNDTTMLVPEPYDDLYIKWLESQIDYYNGEYRKYNNSITAYNDSYSAFEKYYNRTYMPISKGKFKF